QLIATALPLFSCRLFAGRGQAVEQPRDLLFLTALLQCLDQTVKSGLIVRVDFDGLAALLDGLASLAGVEVEPGENGSRFSEVGGQRDSLASGGQSGPKLRTPRIRTFLRQNVGFQVQQVSIIGFAG